MTSNNIIQFKMPRVDLGPEAEEVDGLELLVQGDDEAQAEAPEPEAPEAEPTPEPINGAELLDRVTEWFANYLAADPLDLEVLALFTVHTHLAAECYTTPRILLDSPMPGSGKTTACEHIKHLCRGGTLMATVATAATMARLVADGNRTLLIDEVDRALDPRKDNVGDLIAVLNSGYKFGATRPTVEPTKGGGWTPVEHSTFAPAVLSGNSPRLPDDTRSRCIRILLMPDFHGTVAESDWEFISEAAQSLQNEIAAWADSVRDVVRSATPTLPDGCKARSREKWRPLARVAEAAGGDWPSKVEDLIVRDLAEDQADREAGLRSLPPGMVLAIDLYQCWPKECGPDTLKQHPAKFAATEDLIDALALHNPPMWAENNFRGKGRLTPEALSKMLRQVGKVNRVREDGRTGRRGYSRANMERFWHTLGIDREGPGQPGAPDAPGGPGATHWSEGVS